MFVDVIIPTYGPSPYLISAINSALNQGDIVKSIIVIDDGSPVEIVESIRLKTAHMKKVQFISANRHSNPAIVRNIGVGVATAKYVAFLDADDVWQEGKIQRQLSEMSRNKADFLCSNALRMDMNSQTKYFIGRKNRRIKTFNLIRNNGVITSTVIVDRSIFNKIGGFPEDYSVRGVEDYLAWLRLSQEARMFYIDETLAEYLMNPDGISQSSHYDNSVHALVRFLQDLREMPTVTLAEKFKIYILRLQIFYTLWAR